ncbi:uncharacterized protein IL334_003321 [Kwoniella shivajii]|uniref:DNA repair protein REV1 n=1 Tax=Kwoniella shivajii TaxID=564305 RepID=A0ABZ1D076_9TREE|nr:hypothetical protein IL334_003321 [Kwoniella shivajii]
MSQQRYEDGTPSSPPPPPSNVSSFPLSSPTFWTEAAAVSLPSPPSIRIKRQRNDHLSSPQSDYTVLPELELQGVKDEDDDERHNLKKGRFDSPSESNSTTLSYLPKRSDLIDFNDPHSYLQNPEYAPNKFGDIGDYMRKKEIKVQTQNRDIALAAAIGEGGLPQIFKGLSFYINGNTHPPMEELRKLILQRGGEVRPVLRNKGMVKFIIAPMLTQSKFKQFQNYKVVTEGWITTSCEKGKLLDWTNWKLQILGGWEQNSRKGMEGFFKSQQNPTQQREEEGEEDAKAEEAKDELGKIDEMIASKPNVPRHQNVENEPRAKLESTTPAPERPASPIRLSSITQSLLTPYRPPTIPISPRKSPSLGQTSKAEGSPAPLPAKIQKPEGAWEYYHSTESNENAAKALKSDEWRAKNTAERGNEGGFIDGYYQNSRLHHLSTWKSELKVLVADAQKRSDELSLSTPSASTIPLFSLANSTLPTSRTGVSGTGSGEKVIFHVDFDCFFVSCGLATRPHLKGKPTVVCHSQAGKGASSTSEIASCSYEARAKGVKNGMSLGRARTLVGDELQTIPYEFETYKKYSLAFYTVLMGYADELQAVSVDEALIDATSAVNARAMAPEEASEEHEDVVLEDEQEEMNGHDSQEESKERRTRTIRRNRDPAVEVAEKIRDEVRKLTDGCEVSIGISHNILLAKLATRSAKPAGVAHLLPGDIPDFLAPLDVEGFPSIGYSIKSKIEEKFGSTTVSGLLGVNKLSFQRVLGPKTGGMLFDYLRGVDERRLEPDKTRKSVSAEMNYGIRFKNQDQAEICINDLAAEVAKRMKNVNVKGKQITLKLMKRHPEAPIEPPKFLGHGWCETSNRSATLSGPRGGGPTDDPEILGKECLRLLRAMRLDPVELRGVGIQVTKLDSEEKDKIKDRETGQGLLSFQPKSRQNQPKAPKIDKPISTMKIDKLESENSDSSKRVSVSPIQLEISDQIEIVHDVEMSRSPSVEEPLINGKSPSPEPQPVAGPSRLPVTIKQDDEDKGIDPSFLAALPASLQEEVKRDYYAQSRSRSSRAASERAHPVEPIVESSQRATTVSPMKKQKHSAAHITRQLRPKVKTHLKANQLAEQPLFNAWSKAQQQQSPQEIVDLTGSDPIPPLHQDGEEGDIDGYRTSDLRELGLDIEVFQALPAEMRKEVFEEEQRKAGRRKILLRPGTGNFSRGPESISRGRSISHSISPSKQRIGPGSISSHNGTGTKGKESMMPCIKISKSSKPALFKATELEDILKVIEQWIESRNGNGPAKKDSVKVKNWLLKSIQLASGLKGIETVVEVLKFMQIVLREKWPLQESFSAPRAGREGIEGRNAGDSGRQRQGKDGDGDGEGEGEVEGDEEENRAGKEWWETWKEYKDEIQLQARKSLGAELKI